MALLQVNPDCEIRFEGWQSSTRRLAAHGWDLSLDAPSPYGETKRIMLHHKASKLVLVAESEPFYNEAYRYAGNSQCLPIFNVRQVIAKDSYITVMQSFEFTSWINASPKMIDTERIKLSEYPLFFEKNVPAQELIVEPQEVSEILAQLMARQSPAQAAIRARRRLQEVPQIHANILAFA
jgi:hypothetical protein